MNANLAKRLRFCTTLPSLPAIAIKIIDLANDPETDIGTLCQHIAYDPALSVKILKIANSPLYKSRRSATNIRQAVSLLGTHTVIVIALSFSLTESFVNNSNDASAIDSNQFWRRSIAAALACRALGEKLGINSLDDFFLVGLLQDIGILVYSIIMPEEYTSVFLSANDHDTLLEREREAFSAGHDELGYTLLKQWHIPDCISKACLTSHGQPKSKELKPTLENCAAVSRYLADYFLTPNNPEKLAKLSRMARSWLDIDETVLVEVIDIMADGLKSVEDLFDITIHHSSEITGIMAEAKELLTIHSLSKVKELEEKSYRDGLTGTNNRRFFDESLNREFHLSAQHQFPLSIAMIDLDHFKKINDTYGHITGDNILVAVAKTISDQIRRDDTLCRYGGEEFALILPGTTLAISKHITRRIKEQIATISYQHEDNLVINLTASIGVACLDSNTQFKLPEDLVKAADSALYAAKNAGRNQVVEWKNDNDMLQTNTKQYLYAAYNSGH